MRAERLDTVLEKLIGPLLGEAMAGSFGTDEDPLLAPWVRRIGDEIAAFSPRDDLKPRFSILASDVANAVALPGGQIFVTRGLLDSVTSDDELAGVLAHEIGHVARRHALKHLGENGAVLALLSLVKSRDVRVAGTVLNVLRGLARSRTLEAQADEIGLGLAAAAGYDPRGLVRFLESIAGGKTGKIEEYFLTHPTPEKRLQACRRSPLIQRLTRDDREALAAGLTRRGRLAGAAAVRAGRDPLALGASPLGPALTGSLARDRESVVQQASASLTQLTGVWKAQKISGTLQQLLFLNNQPGDLRWLILAARAYSVQSRLLDAYARSVRTLRLAPGVGEALLRAGIGPEEADEALRRAGQVHEPLGRASRATLGVLGDLNLRLWRLSSREQWLRFGALEGLLRYAESELSRVDERSGQGWRLLSRARLRHYQLRLDRLIAAGGAFTTERLGTEPLTSGAGAIRRALALETDRREAELEAQRGPGDWIEAVEKWGVPENVATVLRLAVLDRERETQFDYSGSLR